MGRAGGAIAEGHDKKEEGHCTSPGNVLRSNLVCASQGCSYRVHRHIDTGGYCCRVCYVSDGGEHGPKCEHVQAPPGAKRVDAYCIPTGEEPRAIMVQQPPEPPKLRAQQFTWHRVQLHTLNDEVKPFNQRFTRREPQAPMMTPTTRATSLKLSMQPLMPALALKPPPAKNHVHFIRI